MRKSLVMTITGNDQIGIVEEVTGLVLNFNGNVDASKMARLGGEFAMLMLVSVPADQFEALRDAVRKLREKDYKVSTRETTQSPSQRFADWATYKIHVKGADHEGIIHDVTHHLAQQGVNIESVETGMEPAPMSGGILFTMNAIVMIPPSADLETLREELEDVGNKLNVDTEILPHSNA